MKLTTQKHRIPRSDEAPTLSELSEHVLPRPYATKSQNPTSTSIYIYNFI